MVTVELLSPTDIIAGILFFLHEKFGIKSLPTDRTILHSIFYKQREKGWGLLRDFRFDTGDIYPYSPTFDEALANMQITGKLNRSNPDMEEFDISESIKSYFENTLNKKFKSEQVEQLGQISEQLSAELKK